MKSVSGERLMRTVTELAKWEKLSGSPEESESFRYIQQRADFEPLTETVIIAVAPGHCPADPTDYPFRRLRQGVRLKPLGLTIGRMPAALNAQPAT